MGYTEGMRRAGFTFFEIILSVAILAILSAAVIMLVNPSSLYAKARNTERVTHVNIILSAIGENMADNRGSFNCAAGALPTSTKRMATGSSTYYDIAPCLAPAYIPDFPYDRSAAGAHFSSTTDYDSGYSVVRNASSGVITVTAPFAELGVVISSSR